MIDDLDTINSLIPNATCKLEKFKMQCKIACLLNDDLLNLFGLSQFVNKKDTRKL